MELDMNSSIPQADNKLFNQIYQEKNKFCKNMIKNKTYPYLNIPLKLYKRDFVAISPNLSYLVICPCSSNSNAVNKLQIEIFDIRKSKNYLLIPLKEDRLHKVCFSFDEKYIIIGYLLHDIEIWDLNNKRINFIVQYSFKSNPLCDSISCSDYNLGFATKNNSIQLWSLTEKYCLFEVFIQKPNSICFSPDSQLFAYSSNIGNIKIIKMDKEIILSLDTYEFIIKMAFSQNSEILIYSLSNKNLIVYNIKSKNEIFRWNTIGMLARDFSISYNGDLITYFNLDGISESVNFIQICNSTKIRKFERLGIINQELIESEKSFLILNDKKCNLRLIDIRMMREQSVLIDETEGRGLAFSPDCKWLAIGMHLKVKMICIKDKEKNWEFDANGYVTNLKFSADSQFLGFWAYPNIKILNVSEKYRVLFRFNEIHDVGSHGRISFDISHDNKHVACGMKNCILVRKIDGGEVTKYEWPSKSIWSVEYNKKNFLIATAYNYTHILILDVNRNKIIHSIPFNKDNELQRLFFIGKNILVKSQNKILKIHIKSQKIVTLIENYEYISFSHDKKLLLCYFNGRFNSLIDVKNECSILSCNDFIEKLISGISAVCDKYLAVADKGKIYLSEIEVLIDEKEIINNFFGLKQVYISKHKAFTIKPTESNVLQISESKNPLNSYEISTHSKHSNSIALSKDDQMIALSSNHKSIEVWNLKSKQKLFTLSGHSDSIISLYFSFDSKSLVSGAWDSTVRIWNLYDPEKNFIFYGHKNGVNLACLDRVGKYVASCSLDRDIRVWDIETKKEVKCFKIGLARSMCFSKRNKYIAVQIALCAKVYRLRI